MGNDLYRCIIDSEVRYLSVSQLQEYVAANDLVVKAEEDQHGWYLTFKPRPPKKKLAVV